MRIETLAARFDLRLHWTHFPLHPETPQEGRTLEDLFAGRNLDLEGMKARMKQLMQDEGLPYGDRSKTYNSRLAQELAKWAETRGADSIHDALFRAYFVDGLNIGLPDVLGQIASDVGLEASEALDVVETRSFRDAIDRDWTRSRQLGVTGVPTFVAGELGVVGAQPYEVLEDLVQRAGATLR